MDYGKAFGFYRENPKWFNQILMGAVCQLVPIAGPMVWDGYLYLIVQRLHEGRRGYPDFDTNQLGNYLKRGLWPVVVFLILGLVIGGVLAAGMIALMAITAAAQTPWVMMIGFPIIMVLYLIAALFAMIVALPMRLYFGLRQQFDWPEGVKFTRDFLGKVGGQVVVSQIVLTLVSIPAGIIGYLACLVGLYPVMAWLMMSNHHLVYQLYELYLQRGGTPIPAVFDEADDLPSVTRLED